MKQFAVAIIGCGNVSRMHFEAYLPHQEYEVSKWKDSYHGR
jgi:predicted dehydrogenase